MSNIALVEVLAGTVLAWGLGLAPALFARYVWVKAPLPRRSANWIAGITCATFWLAFRINNAAAEVEEGSGPQGIVWIVIFFASRWIMTREPKKSPDNNHLANDAQSPHLLNRRRLLTWPLNGAVLAFALGHGPEMGERLAMSTAFAIYFAVGGFFAAVVANLMGKGVTKTVNPFADAQKLAYFSLLLVLLIAAKAIGFPFAIAASILMCLIINPSIFGLKSKPENNSQILDDEALAASEQRSFSATDKNPVAAHESKVKAKDHLRELSNNPQTAIRIIFIGAAGFIILRMMGEEISDYIYTRWDIDSYEYFHGPLPQMVFALIVLFGGYLLVGQYMTRNDVDSRSASELRSFPATDMNPVAAHESKVKAKDHLGELSNNPPTAIRIIFIGAAGFLILRMMGEEISDYIYTRWDIDSYEYFHGPLPQMFFALIVLFGGYLLVAQYMTRNDVDSRSVCADDYPPALIPKLHLGPATRAFSFARVSMGSAVDESAIQAAPKLSWVDRIIIIVVYYIGGIAGSAVVAVGNASNGTDIWYSLIAPAGYAFCLAMMSGPDLPLRPLKAAAIFGGLSLVASLLAHSFGPELLGL